MVNINMVKIKVTQHWASKPYKKVVKLELAFESLNVQSNGPVLSFKTIFSLLNCLLLSVATGGNKKNALYLSVNVFSTKVLIADTIFTSPNGDGTAILRGHPSHAKVSPLAVQRKYLHFSFILRP